MYPFVKINSEPALLGNFYFLYILNIWIDFLSKKTYNIANSTKI